MIRLGLTFVSNSFWGKKEEVSILKILERHKRIAVGFKVRRVNNRSEQSVI